MKQPKLLHLLRMALVLALFCSFATSMAYDFEVDGIYYNKTSDTTVEVTYNNNNYASYSGDIVIPSTISVNVISFFHATYTVTAIGDRAFYGCALNTITLPETILSIGDSALCKCPNLISITTFARTPPSLSNSFDFDWYGISVDSRGALKHVLYVQDEEMQGNYYASDWTWSIYNIVVVGLQSESPNIDVYERHMNYNHPDYVTSALICISAIGDVYVSYTGGEYFKLDTEPEMPGIGIDRDIPCIDLYTFAVEYGKEPSEIIEFSYCLPAPPSEICEYSPYSFETDSICYRFINNNSVAVAPDVHITSQYIYDGSGYYPGETDCYCYGYYQGQVSIPETVSYYNETYNVTAIDGYTFGDYGEYFQNEDEASFCAWYYGEIDGRYLTSIVLPNSITAINDAAFYECKNLSQITIPNSVTYVGENAFYGCDNIRLMHLKGYGVWPGGALDVDVQRLDVASGITAIPGLKVNPREVYCYSAVPPICDENTFTDYTGTLHVPESSLAAYFTAPYWCNFLNIVGDAAGYVNENNSFMISDTTVMHGDTVVIPVSMSNEDEITAFQTDVYLPEGFEMVKEDGEYLIELSDRKSRTHVIMANDAPEGFVRILSYSSGLKPFTGNDGELFYITVKVPDDGDGVYPVELRNTRLTTTGGDELSIADASCDVTVYPYIMGDANNSGDVTITDVVVTARYILFYNPIPFVFGAADVNADGQITVTDAVRIAYMVLGGNTLHAPSRAPVLTSDWMSGMCQLSPDGTGTVSINLDNSTDYTAVQFDLALPDGVSAGNFRLTDRAGNHMLGTGTSEEGSVRVLCYSPSLLPIDGHDGALLTFDVTATGEEVGNISATGIELVSTSGQSMMIAPFSISLSRSTGVVESSACKTVRRVDYYNLAGQRIANPENGVSIIVTTYSDGSRSTAKVIK